MLENECEITSLQVPAETEERISKKKAVALFDDGTLNALEAGAQFASTDCPFRMSGAGSSVEAVWVSR